MVEGLSPEALGAGGIVVGLVVFVILVKVLKAALKMALFVAALVVIAAVVYVYVGGDLRGAVPAAPTLPSFAPAEELLNRLAQDKGPDATADTPTALVDGLARDVVQKLPPELLQKMARDLPDDLNAVEP